MFSVSMKFPQKLKETFVWNYEEFLKHSNLWIKNYIIVDFSVKEKVCGSKHIRKYMYIC